MNITRAAETSSQAVSPESILGTRASSRTGRGNLCPGGALVKTRGTVGFEMMGTSRLETFADGVLAIAATLLILDVSVSGSPLSTQLGPAWPSYVAYMVSFLTIGIIWVNHHAIMDQVARCDRTFLIVNVFFLMVVAFIPFPTRLVAQHLRGDGAEAAAITYGITLTLTAVFFNILWFYAA